MGLLNRLFGSSVSAPQADVSGSFTLDDPRLAELLRFGDVTATGVSVNVQRAMKNPAMFRAVSLISNTMGMLPMQLIDEATKEKAASHPLYRVLHRRPNAWQSAFDFRALMQFRALVKGDAFALIVRSRDLSSDRASISQLVPLDPDRVEMRQREDWSVVYSYQPPRGERIVYAASDIFHLRGLSFDGLRGVSLVKQASESIALALVAQLAAGRMFKNGTFVGAALEMPEGKKLSPEAFDRLKASLAEKEGAENAGKNIILEEGLTYKVIAQTAKDAELAAIRKMQVEEIARITGTPRPLLMLDETNWGTGVEALGRFFVQYGLNPWFEAWQQAAERSLLDDDEADRYTVKVNAGALLRGSMKDQADFFAKALGAGGQEPFMTQNEVRDMLDMPGKDGGDDLGKGAMSQPATGNDNGGLDGQA
jgi:HK97 family phage portal protein